MADNDVYESNHYTRHAEQVCVLRHFWRVTNTLGTGATQVQIAAAVDGAIASPLKALMASSAEYLGTKCSKIFPTPRTFATDVFTSTGFGGVAGDPVPRQSRGIVTLTTANAGRSWRGRRYIPFPSETSNDSDGTPTGPYLTALDTLGTALITTLVGVGGGGNTCDLEPVLAKLTYVGHVLNSITMKSFAGRISRNRWATQRRSGSYGRPNVTPF